MSARTISESTRVYGLFVNLPVADLPRSRAFFEALGFAFNPQFSDDTAACLVLGERQYAMLLTHAKFAAFTSLPIADARQQTAHLIALSLADRAEVDRLAEIAIAKGGSAFRPIEDMGFMYCRAIADPDGHVWELFWMDGVALQDMQAGA
ncbi:MAG TPA: VOC family protein [Patescibacteria group bacterium]|nr:VOC family protein [Patescibacteria group bacterium]